MPRRAKGTLTAVGPTDIASTPPGVVVHEKLFEQSVDLWSENARLMETVGKLEQEIEDILTSFSNQELRILDGYLVSVRPGINVPFAARCPKLRAVAQGETMEEALADLKEAMDLFLTYRSEAGKPVPPKDVEA